MSEVFLIFSLFFPRITLFFAWMNHCIPTHNFPWWGSFWMAIFIPRILVLIYIIQNIGTDNAWFWIHLIVTILAYAEFYNHNKD